VRLLSPSQSSCKTKGPSHSWIHVPSPSGSIGARLCCGRHQQRPLPTGESQGKGGSKRRSQAWLPSPRPSPERESEPGAYALRAPPPPPMGKGCLCDPAMPTRPPGRGARGQGNGWKGQSAARHKQHCKTRYNPKPLIPVRPFGSNTAAQALRASQRP